MRLSLIRFLLILICLGPSAAQSASPSVIKLPNAAYPTVQAAVDAVAQNGTIQFAAGTFYGPIHIGRKHLTFAGTSLPGQASTLTVQSPADSVIVLTDRLATLVVRDLHILGGSDGILSTSPPYSDTDKSAATLSVTNATIAESGRGIAGVFASVRLSNVVIAKCSSHGISLTNSPSVTLVKARLLRNGGLGLLFASPVFAAGNRFNSLISTSTFEGNGMGGAEITPVFSLFTITNCEFTGNAGAGLTQTGGTHLKVVSSKFNSQLPDAGGHWGDGVRIIGAIASLAKCELSGNTRTGISVHGVNAVGQNSVCVMKDCRLLHNGTAVEEAITAGSPDAANGMDAFVITTPNNTPDKNICLPASASGSVRVKDHTTINPNPPTFTPSTP